MCVCIDTRWGEAVPDRQCLHRGVHYSSTAAMSHPLKITLNGGERRENKKVTVKERVKCRERCEMGNVDTILRRSGLLHLSTDEFPI